MQRQVDSQTCENKSETCADADMVAGIASAFITTCILLASVAAIVILVLRDTAQAVCGAILSAGRHRDAVYCSFVHVDTAF